MTLMLQVNDTAFLVLVLFGTTLLAWRYLVAALVFFTTSLILIWVPA